MENIIERGYYRRRNGKIMEVVYTKRAYKPYEIMAISDNGYDSMYTITGNFHSDSTQSEFDLVEYIGKEMPKAPRKFTFEAYMEEDVDHTGVDSISINLGHYCSSFNTKVFNHWLHYSK